jgi:hypothetical protein
MGTRARNSDGSRGPYAWLTYDEVWTRVSHFGSGLLNLGYKKVPPLSSFSLSLFPFLFSSFAPSVCR